MKKKLLLLLYTSLLYTFIHPSASALFAQPCENLKISFTAADSRCMATGSITVTASGGSGNYNYKVAGPVQTNYTTSHIISGLQSGIYTISVKDANTGCVVEMPGAEVGGEYQDPRFQLSKTDVSCALNDGTISVNGLQNGRSPFSYTIIAPSPWAVGTISQTGQFTNLLAGEYSIQMKDSCGGIQVRKVTIENYNWWFENTAVAKTDCDHANASISLKDNKGNINNGSDAFANFSYGVVNVPGDTSWFTDHNFNFLIGKKRSVVFVAKDPCSTIRAAVWNEPVETRPAIGNIATTDFTCAHFDASVSGAQNLTAPVYTLYKGNTTEVVGSNGTGAFTNLPYGDYCLNVRDNCYDTTIVKCFTIPPPVKTLDATPIITNQTCTTFTATIAGSNLVTPTYCLIDSLGKQVACNVEGIFNNVPYGRYCITATDACTGAVLQSCFTSYKPIATLVNYGLNGQSCTVFNVSATGNNLFNAQYCLFDELGNMVMCNDSGIFNGVPNGSYCIKAISCGDTTNSLCFSSGSPDPFMGDAITYNKTCSSFTIGLTGLTNINNPSYNLYNDQDVLLYTNATGTFENLPYGKYCIKVTDGCRNTTLTRCVTETRPKPSVSATIGQTNTTCSTFTARVENQQNLTNPVYYLKDRLENIIAQNTTGIFPDLSYGEYLIDIVNTCYDTTIRLHKVFLLNYTINLSSSKSCTSGTADVRVSFSNGIQPYAVRIYAPGNVLVHTRTASGSFTVNLPALASGQVYTIEGTDNCGRTVTKTVTPNATVVTKAIVAQSKCPSSTWQNGSGNLVVSYTSNYNSIIPSIIKKNGNVFPKAHSSQSGNSFTFSDLEPATYIVEYVMQSCNSKLYDTFALQPYTFPTQGLSAIYQCDNNSFSLGANITGGVGPYTYQIIGSMPETPSIIGTEQTNPIFNINNGTVYSLVRLRSMDACGNATLNDVSVLPLQNISMKASNDCFFQNVVLSVDTIPNASYQWFKKTGANDSVLLTTDLTYNLPFMQPEDIGTYVCKVTINDGCITRIASYTLDGDCGHEFLPGTLQLKGAKATAGNTLQWNAADATTTFYTVERKTPQETQYNTIAEVKAVPANGQKQYSYTDAHRTTATYQYRIKAITGGGKITYSNSITLTGYNNAPVVYPNPVTTEMNISFSGKQAATYRVELHNTAGQAVYKTELKNVTTLQYRYGRNPQLKAGMYVLKITNTTTGETVHHKLLFK